MYLTVSLRAGATLAELVVALAITAVAGAMGAGMLVTAERRSRADAASDRGTQIARDVAHVLGSVIPDADPAYVAVRDDTALDVGEHVGISVVCSMDGRSIVVPGAQASEGDAFTAWRSPPERGDMVLVWDTVAGAWFRAAADSVSERNDGGGCPATGPFRSTADSIARTPVVRFRLTDSLPARVGPGAPVRVARRARWALYRSSDRTWWLGYRRCPGGACGAAQPVAGPLAPPPDSGLRFSRGADGTVSVTMRVPRSDGSPVALSVTRVWALRGAPRGGT